MLKDFSTRPYQQDIFEVATTHNTLVVLPTGLGKTAIAMLLAARRTLLYTESKILFLAPTKPLVEQQLESFRSKFIANDEEFVLFTGAIPPTKRHEQWKKAKYIFSTPQTIENDVLSKKINLEDVSLLVIDEAHRATGDYAYVFLAQQYEEQAKHPRILALTASPGTDKETITEVMTNLYIEKIEYRKIDSSDVTPYTQETTIKWEYVVLSEKHRKIVTYLEKSYNDKIKKIQENGFLKGNKQLSKTQLLLMQRKLHAQISSYAEPELLQSVSLLAQALKLQHAIELAQTQTIRATHAYMQGVVLQAEHSKTKAIKYLAADPEFRAALAITRELQEENKEHPKVDILIHNIFQLQQQDKNTKSIIFTQFRETALLLQEKLEQLLPVTIFFGQAKKNGHGLSQKQQKQLLDDFRSGIYKCLIATSVAEEGLDIPAVDNVFFFEPIPSAIRSVQRRGRTGRHTTGNVVVMVTKETRDEINKWVSFHKEKRMYTVLEELQKNVSIHKKEQQKTQQQLTQYTTKENPVRIVADFREKGSPVLKQLLKKNTDLELKQLSVGDFVLSKDVCVEYKTYNDFVGSIVDNRLLIQLRSLTQYTKPLVIIEGEPDHNQHSVDKTALFGMLAAITISYKIPVLQTRTPTETADLLLTIAKREQDDSKNTFTFHTTKPFDDKTLMEYVVSSLPNIGGSLAKQLLEHFDTIESLVSATEDELKKIPLIGEKKAAEIRRILSTSYTKAKDNPYRQK